MTETETVKPKVREYFIFDNKIVNEQKCKDDGFVLLSKGEIESFEIHFHKAAVTCVDHILLADEKDTCYNVTKEDL
jgi:hypothetical protein